MDSFSDCSLTPSGSSGIPVRNRKSTAAKFVNEADTIARNKGRELALAGIERAMEHLQQPTTRGDEFHTFGMYVASELRSIKDTAYAKAGQRQLNKVLLEIMEKEPVKNK